MTFYYCLETVKKMPNHLKNDAAEDVTLPLNSPTPSSRGPHTVFWKAKHKPSVTFLGNTPSTQTGDGMKRGIEGVRTDRKLPLSSLKIIPQALLQAAR